MVKSEADEKVFKAVKDLIKQNGYSPSVREIQSRANIKSTSTTWASLNRLKDAGKIDFQKNSPRTITLKPKVLHRKG